MLERASGQFIVEGQVEDIFGGSSGVARLARISQTCRFSGGFEGESVAEYTAVHPNERGGAIRGFQRLSGKLGEREGSFVVQVAADYVKGCPHGEWSIVPKTGTGDFQHIRGEGSFSQTAGKPGNYAFEFDLRKPRKPRDISAVNENTVTQADLIDAKNIAPVQQESTGPHEIKPVRKRKPKPPAPVETTPAIVTGPKSASKTRIPPVSPPGDAVVNKPVRSRKTRPAPP